MYKMNPQVQCAAKVGTNSFNIQAMKFGKYAVIGRGFYFTTGNLLHFEEIIQCFVYVREK